MPGYGPDLAFIHHAPTRVVYGRGVVRELPMEIDRLGCARAIVVTDAALRAQTDVVARVLR